MRVASAVGLTWLIIFIVPIIFYGVLSSLTGLQPPGDSPVRFLAGVGVTKIGTALAFVLIFLMARNIFGPHWLAYAGVWWAMFALSEIGQAIGPAYPWQFAATGVISEAVYFPLSGLIVSWLLPAVV